MTLHWNQMADGGDGRQPPRLTPKWLMAIWSRLKMAKLAISDQ